MSDVSFLFSFNLLAVMNLNFDFTSVIQHHMVVAMQRGEEGYYLLRCRKSFSTNQQMHIVDT